MGQKYPQSLFNFVSPFISVTQRSDGNYHSPQVRGNDLKTRLHHSERNNTLQKQTTPSGPEELLNAPHLLNSVSQIATVANIGSVNHNPFMQNCFRSGAFRQNFGFKSAYYPFERPRSVTTRHREYVMVDFIFYSRCFSEKYSKIVENNLKLLSRLNLYTEKECIEMGHLPNKICPSDHLCLVAKFLWTKT